MTTQGLARPRKIAVVYHVPNPGGVTRFTHALIDGLLEIDPAITIDYYVSSRLLEAGRVDFDSSNQRVRLIGISDPRIVGSNIDEPVSGAVQASDSSARSVVRRMSAAFAGWPRLHAFAQGAYGLVLGAIRTLTGRRPPKDWLRFALSREVCEALGHYDVVYFPFPFYLEPARIDAPLVATFHDVNHKHFPENFGDNALRIMEHQLRAWTARVDAAVVSTEYIRSDFEHFYPAAEGKTSVVYVAPYGARPVAEPARLAALDKFELRDRGYLIYPSNHSQHKNIAGLLRAAETMKLGAVGLQYPIVLTGLGTDGLGTGKWPSLADVDELLSHGILELGRDVIGVGFVTDEEVDALTRSARIVVSTSLYEAGCGPALDAWQSGTPVAFSRIPPFMEQLTALGVEAWLFDPQRPEEIAEVLGEALAEYDETERMASRSRAAIGGYTWQTAARGYAAVFSAAMAHRSSRGKRRWW